MIRQIGSAIVGPARTILPLSAGVDVHGIIYLSGQLSLIDGQLKGANIAEQTGIILDNIEALLGTIGLNLSDIFKVSVWLTRKQDFREFNQVFAERFSVPYPVRSTVVSDLVVDGALIEIEAVAANPHDKGQMSQAAE